MRHATAAAAAAAAAAPPQFRDVYGSAPFRATGLAAAASQDAALSAPYTLMSNGALGYVMVMPVSPTSLVAVGFDAAVAFALVLGDESDDFGLTVVDATAATAAAPPDGVVQLLTAGNGIVATGVPPVVASYVFLGRTWEISVAPSAAWLSEAHGPAQISVIEIGVSLAVLAGASSRRARVRNVRGAVCGSACTLCRQ
jgi:hypothetical protein